jgi:hypothetical protein
MVTDQLRLATDLAGGSHRQLAAEYCLHMLESTSSKNLPGEVGVAYTYSHIGMLNTQTRIKDIYIFMQA